MAAHLTRSDCEGF